jgi:hypothetical protein
MKAERSGMTDWTYDAAAQEVERLRAEVARLTQEQERLIAEWREDSRLCRQSAGAESAALFIAADVEAAKIYAECADQLAAVASTPIAKDSAISFLDG